MLHTALSVQKETHLYSSVRLNFTFKDIPRTRKASRKYRKNSSFTSCHQTDFHYCPTLFLCRKVIIFFFRNHKLHNLRVNCDLRTVLERMEHMQNSDFWNSTSKPHQNFFMFYLMSLVSLHDQKTSTNTTVVCSMCQRSARVHCLQIHSQRKINAAFGPHICTGNHVRYSIFSIYQSITPQI